MPTSPLAALALFGLITLAWVTVMPRLLARTQELKAKKLADVRRRLWDDEPRGPAAELLDRNRFVFVSIKPGWEQRLDHRVEDAHGAEIGSSLQQPRPRRLSRNGPPSRLSTVRIEIRDENDLKQLEIRRPPGLRRQPLEIFDASGLPVGTIKRDGRRSFAVLDASGVRTGRIVRRSRGHTVDYALMDSASVEVGSISDFRHRTKRAAGPIRDGKARLLKEVLAEQPTEHVLELHTPASRVFRSLMLGAAASVYLALQQPFQDGG